MDFLAYIKISGDWADLDLMWKWYLILFIIDAIFMISNRLNTIRRHLNGNLDIFYEDIPFIQWFMHACIKI